MHRTEGQDYELEGVYRRFIDQNLPTEPGTKDTGEYNNAVQEELCNVVELAGLTLNGGGDNGTSVADRAAGWRQVYDAIFQSAHMTDAGIDGITFSKLSGIINLVSGGSEWSQDINGLDYLDGSGAELNVSASLIEMAGSTATDQSFLSALNLSVVKTGVGTRVYPQGLQFSDGPGDVSAFKSSKIRKSAFALSSLTWTQIGTTNIYQDTVNYDTDIPDTVPLANFYGATFISDDGTQVQSLPCAIIAQAVTGFYRINNIKVMGWASTPGASGELVIEYDAGTL